MNERTVTLKTKRIQPAYGDTFLRAEVDFHIDESDFGGCPAAESAIAVVKALWPTARTVDLTATPHPEAYTFANQASHWTVTGTVSYSG